MGVEQQESHPSIEEGLVVSGLLSAVGGFLDAYSYLLMGGVFANAQTGNVVLLALSLLELPATTFLKFLFPILAFMVGVALAEAVRNIGALQTRSRGVLGVLGFEVLTLAGLGFAAPALSPWMVNALVSMVAGVQASSFKKVRKSPFATTMVTGNIRSATELLVRFILHRDRSAFVQARTYLLIVGAFVVGACVGALVALKVGTPSIFVCCGLLASAALVILARGRVRRGQG